MCLNYMTVKAANLNSMQEHFEEDFDINESELTEHSLAGYIKYLEDNDDELPEGYYQSKTVKRRKDND